MDRQDGFGTRNNRTWLLVSLLLCSQALFSQVLFSQAEAAPPAPPIRLVSSHLVPYAIEDGQQPGFMVELAIEIEKRLGSERPILFLPWPRSLRLVKNQPNHIILPLTRTVERESDYRWLLKVAPIDMAFVTLGGDPVSMDQARSLETISVQQDTPFEHFLRRQGFTNLVSLPNPGALHLRMLKAGRTQAWFTAKDLARHTRAESGQTEPLVLGETAYRSYVYIATSLQFPEDVAAAYRQAYQELVSDGTVQAIMARYRH